MARLYTLHAPAGSYPLKKSPRHRPDMDRLAATSSSSHIGAVVIRLGFHTHNLEYEACPSHSTKTGLNQEQIPTYFGRDA